MNDPLDMASDPTWLIEQRGYDPLGERGFESRFAIGNGFLGVRGVPTVRGENIGISWPRTYVAGLFDEPNVPPHIPALVPAPDWLGLTVLVDGEPLIKRPEDMPAERRTLDLRRGMLLTSWTSTGAASAVHKFRSLRLVSMAERALALQILQLELGGDAEITLDAWCAAPDPALVRETLECGLGVWRTESSRRRLAMASASVLRLDGEGLAPDQIEDFKWRWRWTSQPGQVASLERWAAFARGDGVGADPAPAAIAGLRNARHRGVSGAIQEHSGVWDQRWRCSEVELKGDDRAQQALRFAAYHLNSAANPADERTSVGARALTGDDYRGHIFWDTEIFLVPFFTLTWPEAARSMLMYRYHSLGGARAKAARMGWRGAFYAWESASSGQETTPAQIIDADGQVIEILSGSEEEHVTADVAYAVWQYWRATEDDAFFLAAGAEIILETARFWASRAQPEADGQRHIRDVEGPDEYHEHIDDNAFTNAMARWNLRRGLDVATLLKARWPERWSELAGRIELGDADLHDWRATSATLATGYDAQTGLFEQFAGFFKLDEIDLAAYADRTTPMDVVLGREATQHSQVIKQADVVAMLALLPEEFDDAGKLANFRYYEPRCDHGSSLSPAMHAMVAARLGDTELALRYFREATSIDLGEPAGRSAGGVHIATQGGLWQAAVFGFGGLALKDDGLTFDPHLPAGWTSLAFRIQWRGRELKVRIECDRFIATLERGLPMTMLVAGKACELRLRRAISVPSGSAKRSAHPEPGDPLVTPPAGPVFRRQTAAYRFGSSPRTKN